MKWEEDLIRDIKTYTSNDDLDAGWPEELRDKLINGDVEFTEANHNALQEALNRCKRKKYFLEIGVHRNGENSSTHTIIKNMDSDGIYLGVDINDKTFLNNPSMGIHTIQANSSDYEQIVSKLDSLGVKELDFIFIDGDHSINQVLRDWEYTKILSEHGVVAFHDTTHHAGPNFFIYALNTDKWEVFPNLCPLDYGLGYCIRRN